ncbi:MAG: HK97 family phage prohead protease [Sterolibacterium sp.]|nr:HK97 family phage prohead protease [Sterolibacterium sp.]
MNTIRSVFPFRELKFDPGTDDSGQTTRTFSGYGAAFNNVDAYGDVIMPGAFADFLSDAQAGRQPWPSMLSQHGGWGISAEDLTPVGVWQELAEDGNGLRVTGQLADTPRGNEIDKLLRMTPRPAIDGLSIGYIPKKYEPRSKPEDPRRRITQIDLIEISPVTFPANRNARISSIKSIADMDSITELEDLLRDAGGFSRSEAKSIIARIKGHDLRDAEQHLQRMHAAAQRIITNFTTQGK